MERRRLGPAIVHRDQDQQVLGRGLGIFDEDVEIAILVEDPGIEQLVFLLLAAAGAVGLDQVGIGKGGLGIFVEILAVGMGRRALEIEIVFLDVLAVIAFAVGQAEGALLQDRVDAVPQRQREAEPLLVVAEAGEAVLAPAIGPRAGVVMGKIVPGLAGGAVVLAHGAPLALAEIGAPFAPVDRAVARLAEALLLLRHRPPDSLYCRISSGSRSADALSEPSSPFCGSVASSLPEASPSSSALAAMRSAVPKPSVNQP